MAYELEPTVPVEAEAVPAPKAPTPEPPAEPTPDLPPSPQGLLESQRDTLMAQLTNYPPLHAEHKRIRSAIAELEAAIRERDRLSAP
jgi:hypothetical protein